MCVEVTMKNFARLIIFEGGERKTLLRAVLAHRIMKTTVAWIGRGYAHGLALLQTRFKAFPAPAVLPHFTTSLEGIHDVLPESNVGLSGCFSPGFDTVHNLHTKSN